MGWMFCTWVGPFMRALRLPCEGRHLCLHESQGFDVVLTLEACLRSGSFQLAQSIWIHLGAV